jgi:hypothetical protein
MLHGKTSSIFLELCAVNSNPYLTPSPVDKNLASARIRRPWGILFVTACLGLPGALLGLWGIGMVFTLPNPWAYFGSLGVGAKVILTVIAPLGLFSSFGIFFRFRWAWFSAQFYCLLIAYEIVRGWAVHGFNPGFLRGTFAGLHALIAVYLYFNSPRQYFGIHKRIAYGLAPLIVLLSVAAYHALTWLPILVNDVMRRWS